MTITITGEGMLYEQDSTLQIVILCLCIVNLGLLVVVLWRLRKPREPKTKLQKPSRPKRDWKELFEREL